MVYYDDLDTLIRSFEDSNTNIQTTLEQLDTLPIKTEGLKLKQLKILFEQLLDPYNSLSIGSRNHILKNYIYFKGLIPSEIIIKIFGKIGVKTIKNNSKRLPVKFQIQLVKWIIAVYSFLEDPEIIARLYNLLFNYLEFDFIRPQIAHLLFLATKNSHVTAQKIERLKNIYNKYDHPESIVGLLAHYQSFAPEEVFDTFTRVPQKIFTHPNFNYFQELLNLRDQNDKVILQGAYDEIKYLKEFENKLKRRKRSLSTLDFAAITQNAIPSLDKLVKSIGSLDIKKNWSTLVFESRGYSLLAYAIKEDQTDSKRLNAWISSFLEDMDTTSKADINWAFESIVKYVETVGIAPDVIIDGLLLNQHHLKNLRLQKYVFFFLSRLSIKHEEKIKSILKVMYEIGNSQNPEWYADFIDAMRYLIISWYYQIETPESEANLSLLFKDIISKLELTIHHFQYNKLLVNSVLRFINLLQSIPEKYLTAQIVVLPEPLVHSLLFLSDPLSFSLICGHLNFSKNALKAAEANEEITRLTNLHNSYVVGICNLIWRNKAFEIPKNSSSAFGLSYEFINALENSVPIYDSNSGFKSLFNIHTNPAFASYSMRIIKDLEVQKCVKVNHEGPLTPLSVKKAINDNDGKWIGSYEEARVDVLKGLEAAGFTGLSELLFSHLKSLVKKK